MKNRLQFNRHYAVYPTREDALQALNNRITDPGFIPLIGEPIVLRYTDEQGNIQTILAIGKKAGSSLADRDYHVVDTAFIDKKIADEIAAREALDAETIKKIVFDGVESEFANNVATLSVSANSIPIGSYEDHIISGNPGNLPHPIHFYYSTLDAVKQLDVNFLDFLAKTDAKINGLHIVKVTEGLDANVREAYDFVNMDGLVQPNSDRILIYKDSSLYNVYLGHMDDHLEDYSVPVVTPGTGDTALCFIYLKADGTYQLVPINIEAFLEESEFKDGLVVNNHEVRVKIDPASETFLTVGPGGVKLSGVQAAIDTARQAEEDRAVAAEETIQAELDATQVGAGLSGNGAYIHYHSANYIDEATSLANADYILDTELKAVSDYAEASSGALATRINLEEARAQDAEGILSHLVSDEAARALAAETFISAITTNIISGAGLNADGTYKVNATANYIDAASSLNSADVILDSAIKSEEGRAKSAEEAIANNLTNLGDTVLALSSATLSEINRAQAKEGQIQDELDTTQTGAGLNADGTYKVNATANFINAATSLNGADVILDSTIKELSANTIAEDNALKDRATALENRKVLGSEAVKVNTENGNSTVSLAINDFDKVLTQDNEGLRANITLTYVPNDKKIYLIGKENGVISEIPTDDFVKDGMLSGASVVVADAALIQQYPEAGLVIGHKYLMLVFNTDTGSSVVFIGVDELVDIYTVNPNSDTYLDITNYVLTAKVDVEHGLAGYDLVRYVSGLTENIISGAGLNMLNPGQYPGHDETHYIKDATSLDNADVILDSVIFALSGAAAADLTELKENVRELSAVTEEVVEKVDNLSAYTVESIEALSAITSEISASTAVYTFRGDENGFITTQTETVVEAGKTVQRTTIKPTMPSSNWDDITGNTVAQGNGFATAYDVKQYVKDGIDGDAIWAGDMTLPIPSPTEENPLVGRINFDKDSPFYDTVHEAFYRVDNNLARLADTIGLTGDGYNAYFYPSARTEGCLIISTGSGVTDIMSALTSIDKFIDGMDWSGKTNENQVFTYLEQENGTISAGCGNIANVKLADYQVVSVNRPSDAATKVAATDTLGQGLGKLQGQINAMDWTGYTTENEVFTAITDTDGFVSAATKLLTGVKLSGYSATANTKVAANQTLGTALGNLQGQINSLNYTAVTGDDYVFTGLTEVSGLVSTTSALTTSRKLAGYSEGTDTKVAATQTLGQALGNLQGQINAMNYGTALTSDYVFTGLTEVSGHVSTTSGYVTSRTLGNLPVSADTKIKSTDSLGTALANLQGQIVSMDYTKTISTDQIFTGVTQVDGKVSADTANVTTRTLAGYGTTADTKVAASQTLGVALGNLQGQINSMNKSAGDATGKFVRTVTEVSGKVSETLGYIVADDVKITAATPSSTNVREEWQLVNQAGTRLGDTIKIYKDSSLDKVELGNIGDLLQGTTSVDQESDSNVIQHDTTSTTEALNFVYQLANGKYKLVQVNVEVFLQESEFASGVVADSSTHIVHGVVDPASENFLTVGGAGFKLSGVQTAINNAIDGLDSESATTGNRKYVTGVTIRNGKITAFAEAGDPQLTTAGTQTGNVLTSLSVNDHQITLDSKNVPEAAFTTIKGGTASIAAGSTADTITFTGSTPIIVTGNNKTITVSHSGSPETTKDAGSGNYIQKVTLDSYGHVIGLTTGNCVNSATSLANKPVLAAGTTDTNKITVKAGEKTSDEFTVPYATNADTVDGYHIVTGSTGTAANTIYFL